MLQLVHSNPWYALQIQTQAHPGVLEGLRWHGLPTYHPTYSVPSQRKYRSALQRPLFPGYVFVRLNLENLDLRHRAISVPGVIRLVGYGETPLSITEREIETIRTLAAAPVKLAPSPVVAGETVCVTNGPLKGMEGVVVHIKGSTRIVVSIGMLNRGVSAEVDASWLAPVKPAPLRKAA